MIRSIQEELDFLNSLESTEVTYPFVNLYNKLSAFERLSSYSYVKSILTEKDLAIIKALRFWLPLTGSYISLIIQEELLPYLITKIKQAPINCTPLDPTVLCEILFKTRPVLYYSIINDTSIDRLHYNTLIKAYKTRDKELLKKTIEDLPLSIFSNEVIFINMIIDLEEMISSFKIFDDEYTNRVSSHLTTILKFIEKLDLSKEEKEILRPMNILRESENMGSKIDETFESFLSKEISSISEAIEFFLRAVSCLYYWMYEVLTWAYGYNHIYVNAFEKILNYQPIVDLGEMLTRMKDETYVSFEKIIKVFEGENTPSANVAKIVSISSERMGAPNAIFFDNPQNRAKFMDEIFKLYSQFSTTDPQDLRYLFGIRNDRPQNYPDKITWNGSKTDFLILLRTLYKKSDGKRSHGIIIHSNESGRETKWSAGTTLKENMHKAKVDAIIELAKKYGGDINGIDGIPWLPNYKKG